MRVGCIQITSVEDAKVNLEKVESYLQVAKTYNCHSVFLPEVFLSKGNGKSNPKFVVKEGDEYTKNLSHLAKKYEMFILGGSVVFDDNGTIRNRVLNFSPDGKSLNHYDKVHMFACDIETSEKRVKLREADLYTPGTELQTVEVDDWKVGLSVCFDLRFPQMYQEYKKQGCHIMSVSSAFTVPTGKAHWHTLLRARAIETQSFVIAAGQWGRHNENMQSYGHSLIIDPWGNILADAGEGEKLIYSDLDKNLIKQTEQKVILKE